MHIGPFHKRVPAFVAGNCIPARQKTVGLLTPYLNFSRVSYNYSNLFRVAPKTIVGCSEEFAPGQINLPGDDKRKN